MLLCITRNKRKQDELPVAFLAISDWKLHIVRTVAILFQTEGKRAKEVSRYYAVRFILFFFMILLKQQPFPAV
jgi:hypothetical protein